VLFFPATNSGDAPFYIDLAWNWLKNRVYGFPIDGQLTPVDMRTPGYPALLAGVFAIAGKSPLAVMLAQTVIDLATCLLIALIASRLARPESRRRVALIALWLAALCPFTANYTAVVLTETLVTFLTALTLLLLLETEVGQPSWPPGLFRASGPWLLVGILAGFGALVRPETPLLLGAAGLVLLAKWRRPQNWRNLLQAGLLMAVGLAIPLAPWAARNWRTLHEVQFLAPRYSQLPGEVVPRGFTAWTNTWLWRMKDVYLVTWNLNSTAISIDDIPSTAFDSPSERSQVAALLDEHNDTLTETARDPLRTYIKVPALRSLALWFTPRTELLPLSGHLWPIFQEWDQDTLDFLMTLALTALGALYLLLACVGAAKSWRRPGFAFVLTFLVLRTAFFAEFVETPEPRYVLECFPVVIALAALAFERRINGRRPVQDES
jgi:4-amino-4-deoxy-L-arabinose transferase-like glycosyltransferase